MQVNSTGMNSYTTQRNNTFYYGNGSISNDAGTRSVSGGMVAVDKGSDGTVDGAAGWGHATGPNGEVAVAGAANQNGAIGIGGAIGPNGQAGAKLATTNYETAQVWTRYA